MGTATEYTLRQILTELEELDLGAFAPVDAEYVVTALSSDLTAEVLHSGLSGGDLHDPKAHASDHENGGSDEISVAGLSGELADDQPPKAHDLGGAKHNADTLANLNAKVSDATLDDSGDTRDPNSHASSHADGGSDELEADDLAGANGTDGQVLKSDGAAAAWEDDVGSVTFIIDGGGSAITTGEKGHLEIPFACTIEHVTMLADQSGSIVVDIWKDTYADFPPTDADSITASAPPTISTAQKSRDSALTGWTTSISAGDILAFNVDSCTSIQRVTISLKVTKS